MSMVRILLALVFLSLLITLHELGHFLMGKLLKFSITGFSIGMGPAIFKKKSGETEFAIRAFPIGGMCQFLGEDEEGSANDPGAFHNQSVWKRFLVVFAGPAVNILFSLITAFIMVNAYGTIQPCCVELTDANGAAAKAGMQAGDILLSINGTELDEFQTVSDLIQAASPDGCVIEAERGENTVVLNLRDLYDPEVGYNRIGITYGYVRNDVPFGQSFGASLRYCGGIIRQTLDFFHNLFRGKASADDVSGPVGTIAIISEAITYGFEVVLELAVMINISLGICNLLPIPALDGGRLLFLIIEAIIGRRIKPEHEGIVHLIGLFLLLLFMLFITFKDIRTLIGG